MRLILPVLLLLICQLSKAQTKDGDNVVTPIPVWNSYKHAWAQCEKLNKINDSLLTELRESNDTLKLKNQSMLRERDKKDSTIKIYRGMLLEPPKRSFTKAYLKPFGEGSAVTLIVLAIYRLFIKPG